jgi:alpha-tubulin suppressor-like RCC1 family protein
VQAPAFSSVVAGQAHSCGLTGEGDVYCWGSNSRGQIGNGQVGTWSPPVKVALSEPALMVAAGSLHTCALLKSRRIACWGDGKNGQLGNGAFGVVSTPVIIR